MRSSGFSDARIWFDVKSSSSQALAATAGGCGAAWAKTVEAKTERQSDSRSAKDLMG